MNRILGFPRIWWPQIRNTKGIITPLTVLNVTRFLLTIISVKLGFAGAKPIHISTNQRILKLNRKSNLGSRNDKIYIENDDVIYASIRLHGAWGDLESRYLGGIEGERLTLLDLGANIGLIIRQILEINPKISKVIAVEPRQMTISNLKKNLYDFSKNKQTEILFCEFALGEKNGKDLIYTQTGNIGNSSLLQSLVPSSSVEEISSVTSQKFYESYLRNDEQYILKSDLQGMDSSILNSFPEEFWYRVKGAVIEVWPNNLVKPKEVVELIQKIGIHFDFSFDPQFFHMVDKRYLFDYWTNESCKSQNLYLRRK